MWYFRYLWREEGDDGCKVWSKTKESKAWEDDTLAPELKLLPHLRSNFFLVGVEHIMHYDKAVKTALRSRTACTTLLVFIFFTNLFLDFKNIKKMTPSHQNSNCFHTCASILFWEGIVHDGTVVHIPVFIFLPTYF